MTGLHVRLLGYSYHPTRPPQAPTALGLTASDGVRVRCLRWAVVQTAPSLEPAWRDQDDELGGERERGGLELEHEKTWGGLNPPASYMIPSL
jgi:hypothetical protein